MPERVTMLSSPLREVVGGTELSFFDLATLFVFSCFCAFVFSGGGKGTMFVWKFQNFLFVHLQIPSHLLKNIRQLVYPSILFGITQKSGIF